MRTFKTYILESKNMHMTHLEDLIFTDGPSGAAKIVSFLDSIIDMLTSDLSEAQKITLKWDGSPAIFAGIDPETGKFFVGTKSIFNKTPKINFTDADIDRNHGGRGELPSKLKEALKYLPSIWKKGVFQGDMMFTKSTLKTKTIDGEKNITFKPNTITYAVPVNSDLGKEISRAKFGIVFHTKYTGKTIPKMRASFNVSKRDFKPSSTVWFDDAEFKDVSAATFNSSEAKKATKLVNGLRRAGRVIEKSLSKIFAKHESHIPTLTIYNNSKFRTGENISINSSAHFDGFVDWYVDREASKKKNFSQNDEAALRKDLLSLKKEYIKVFDFYAQVRQIKGVLISKLNSIKTMGTFLETGKGFKVVGHEGFVAISNDGSSIKLVDRMEFSKNNFTTDKGWSK